MAAVERTVARYALAPKSAKHYVAAKLRWDPVIDVIVGLGFSLGETLDAGAGRGQCGLCLAELGLVSALSGFDWDENKVAVATLAAHGRASYAIGELSSHAFDAKDTILLVDVLHYLPLEEQEQLLARAFSALRPGGRLLIRDVDASAPRSVWTRTAEHVGAFFNVNRAGALAFRSAEDLHRSLRALGASVSQHAASGNALTNVLLVAEKPTRA